MRKAVIGSNPYVVMATANNGSDRVKENISDLGNRYVLYQGSFFHNGNKHLLERCGELWGAKPSNEIIENEGGWCPPSVSAAVADCVG